MPSTVSFRRRIRSLVGAFALALPLVGATALSGAMSAGAAEAIDISGAMPRLEFSMRRASDGEDVTADDYRGKAVLVYFGFTHCPDICPLTLSNLTRALDGLDPETADRIAILLVTVDLERDDLETLDQYQQAFAPQVDALRGDADAMTAMAKRYRVAHSVRKDEEGTITDVMHGAAVYGFDENGRSRRLFSGLSDSSADIPALRRDLTALVHSADDGGWLADLF